MDNSLDIVKWATDYLVCRDYILKQSPKIILETPWSKVIQFATTKGLLYLKQTPKIISEEPKIIQILAQKCQENVPFVIAVNKGLNCFLMKDAGKNLREYLKIDFQPHLLGQAIKEYALIQRSTEDNIADFFALNVPDWRLDKLPALYEQMISRTDLLKGDGLTDKELKRLHDLTPQFVKDCKSLSQYPISETLLIYDFNTNNVLIDPDTKKMTFIDWGEAVITHPFFSLQTYLYQATVHHAVKEGDAYYRQLLEACIENWVDLGTKEALAEAFKLATKFWPIYSVLSIYRLINIIGFDAFQAFYVNRPHRIRNALREYISCSIVK